MTVYVFWLLLLLWNFYVFLLYGADKRRAICNKNRIKEKVLFLCAFFMGAPGSLLGMKIFRHKTKHLYFWLLNYLFLTINVLVVFLMNKAFFLFYK